MPPTCTRARERPTAPTRGAASASKVRRSKSELIASPRNVDRAGDELVRELGARHDRRQRQPHVEVRADRARPRRDRPPWPPACSASASRRARAACVRRSRSSRSCLRRAARRTARRSAAPRRRISLSVVRRSKSELMLSLAMRMSLSKSAGAIVAALAYCTVYKRCAKSEWMSSISSSKPFWPRFCRSHATRSSKLIPVSRSTIGMTSVDEAVGFGAPRLLLAFDEELPFDRAVGAREDGAPIHAVARHEDVERAARRERGDAAAVGLEIDVAFAADAQRVVAVRDAEVHRARRRSPSPSRRRVLRWRERTTRCRSG